MDKENTVEKYNNAKNNIIIAASRLMTEKGVKSTSLSEIAHEIGISKGTLYYYYTSKDDLIFDITEKHLNQISTEFNAWIERIDQEATPSEILKFVFLKILNAETRGKLHLYLINDSLANNESMKNRFKEKYKEWRDTIEDALKKVLKNRATDYSTLASLVLAALDGLIIQWMLGVEKLPIDDITALLSKIE